MPLKRYKITLAYRGTRYFGWQEQATPPTWKGAIPPEGDGIPTVQQTLRKALISVIGHPLTTLGSSRTDAGVHARGQVAHFDADATHIPPENLRRAVNARLPEDVLVRAIEPVAETFDAVSSTLSKQYDYVIWNTADRPVFGADLAWHRWQVLDTTAMSEAAGFLVGTHDFASFAKPGHGREHTIRTVTACELRREDERLIIRVAGTGFLWQMIRIMVGTLVQVGLGRTPAGQIPEMLAARNRRAAGPTAPPHGLYLDRIWTSAHPTPPTPETLPQAVRPPVCHPLADRPENL